MERGTDIIFLVSKITADSDCSHEIERYLLLKRKAMTNLDTVLKSRYNTSYKGPYSQIYGFSSSCVCMWTLDPKESWDPKNWWFWIVVLEKTLKSPLASKIKPVNPKESQPWILEGLVLKLQYFGHMMGGANSLKKTLILGKIEGKRRRGATEDETVR